MRHALSLWLLLAGLAFGQSWTAFTPEVVNLPGKTGDFLPATFTKIDYDDTTRSIIGFQMYTSGDGETPAYNSTIYSNNVFKLAYHPGATPDTIRQLALTNWYTENPGVNNQTVINANFTTSPTPPDVHAYFGLYNGTLYHFGGPNQLIRDTITVSSVDPTDGNDWIDLGRTVAPWGTRDAVQFASSGTTPGGVTAGTTYFLIRVSDTRIKLATTAANAAAGTALNITSAGTGTITMRHSVSDSWHYSGIWTLNLTTGAWAQVHPQASTSWFRGTFAEAQGVIWHRAKQRFWIQPGKNYEATPEYGWSFNPATGNLTEMTTTGNRRNDEAPYIYTSAQSMTYDTRRARVYVFGDVDACPSECGGNSLWYLDTTGAWVEVSPVTPRPQARLQHAVIYIRGADANSDYLLVAGGRRTNNSTQFLDTWLYDIDANTWDSLETGVIPSGNAHTYGTYDRVNGYAILQQGSNWYEMDIGEPDLEAIQSGTSAGRKESRFFKLRMGLGF